MGDLDRLDDLAKAYDAQVFQVRSKIEAFANAYWKSLTHYRDSAMEEMIEAIVPRVIAGQLQTAELTRAYLAACARDLGWKLNIPAVDAELVTGSRGVDPRVVYQRPGHSVYSSLAKGAPLEKAAAAGQLRLLQLIGGDMQLAKRSPSRRSMQAAGMRAYRRILTGRENCALCVVASTQRYWVKDLMPIHPGCDCNSGPLPPNYDPGQQVIDEETLEQIHQIVQERTGSSDRGARTPDYSKLIVTTQHGEYGPVLGWKETVSERRKQLSSHRSLSARNVASDSKRADESARASRKPGVIVPDGVRVADHEMTTAQTLAASGRQVMFRPLSHEEGVKNPDAEINGEIWEFKAPKGSSEKNTIYDQFKRARKQAERLVIDLRRCGLDDELALKQIKNRFTGQERIRHLIAIDHSGALHTMKKE